LIAASIDGMLLAENGGVYNSVRFIGYPVLEARNHFAEKLL
jgi:hypothetical protein